MDHQAFAQLLGNYGEFVGAIAVVVTLVYLSVQIRNGAQATKTENAREIYLQFQYMLDRDDRLVPWVAKYCKGDRSDVVLYGITQGFRIIFNGYESAWNALLMNSVDRAYCEGIMHRWLRHTFGAQTGLDAWLMLESEYPKEFASYINDSIRDLPRPMTLDEQAHFFDQWRESGVETFF